MGYYMRGDYYRGDYYRGDLFGAIGSSFKRLAQSVGRIGQTGARIGEAVGVPGMGLAGKAFGRIAGPPMPPGGLRLGPNVEGHAAGPVAPPGGIMRGYHMNKQKLAPSRAHPKGAAAHTVLVRNRHMNVANSRALARASRRAHGFLKLASKFVRYYRPKAPKGRAYIGRRRKSR